MYSEEDPLSHFKRSQIEIFGFSQKETGAKSVAIVGVILFLITLKSLSNKQQLFFTT